MDRRRGLNELRMTGHVCGMTRGKTLVLFEALHRWEDDEIDLNSGEQAAEWRCQPRSSASSWSRSIRANSEISQQVHERLFARGGGEGTFERRHAEAMTVLRS